MLRDFAKLPELIFPALSLASSDKVADFKLSCIDGIINLFSKQQLSQMIFQYLCK